MTYVADLQVGGTLAAVGQRMLDSVSKTMSVQAIKAFAEYHDMTLGDVLEGIVLHAFDGKTPFSAASLERIRELKKFYELDLDSSASHRLTEIRTGKSETHLSSSKKSREGRRKP